MELKLSNLLYKKNGILYQEVYVNRPIYVFDTDLNTKVHGVLLY